MVQQTRKGGQVLLGMGYRRGVVRGTWVPVSEGEMSTVREHSYVEYNIGNKSIVWYMTSGDDARE